MRLVPLPGVFQPHSDGVLLAEHLAREELGPDASVLDLCTGSGLLALVAALHGAANVTAVDVSRRALLSVRLNARLNRVQVRALRGDLFAPVMGERFDVIVSNPPYEPGPVTELPGRGPARAWEGGVDGRAFLDRICARAHDHLKPGGALLLTHSSVSDIPQTIEQLSASGLRPKIVDSYRGPLGAVLQERSDWLRAKGLVDGDGIEEIVIIRATG